MTDFKQDLFDYIKDLTGFTCLDGDLNEIYDICNEERIRQDNRINKVLDENEALEYKLDKVVEYINKTLGVKV